jgi:hypothetical protein
MSCVVVRLSGVLPVFSGGIVVPCTSVVGPLIPLCLQYLYTGRNNQAMMSYT